MGYFSLWFHNFRQDGALKTKLADIHDEPTCLPYDSEVRQHDELTSLLRNGDQKRTSYTTGIRWEDSGICLNDIDTASWRQDIFSEAIAVFQYAWPLLITFVTAMGMKVIDVWFLGRVNSEVMAVSGLGNLFTTVGGLALGNGLLTAIDTLVAQAFTGASHPHTLGMILQRGLFIMAVFSIPVSMLWLYAEPILLSVGQSPEMAHKAQIYLYYCIPMILPIFISTSLRKFLQSLGKMRITLYMILSIFPFNILSNYFFIVYLQLGYVGAACHTLCFHMIVLLLYTLFLIFGTDFTKTYWPGWSRHALRGYGAFLKLGIPGMLSVSTDWAFEVCAIVTGVLGQTSLAAQSIVLTINSLLLMFPYALSNALLVRIGHHVGANQPRKTKAVIIMSLGIGFIMVTINASAMYILREQLGHHFSSDIAVVEAVDDLVRVACLAHFVMGMSIILSSTLNALGRQPIVASFNLASYYVIGLPFGLWLTSTWDWGLTGVWSGVVLAGLLKCIGEGWVLMYHTDLEEECRLASRRVSTQEVPQETLLPSSADSGH